MAKWVRWTISLFAMRNLDLIWSEGAIYNIGFERGLNEWREFLKTGGTLRFQKHRGLQLNGLPKSKNSGWKRIPE